MKRNVFALSFLVFCFLTYLGCFLANSDTSNGLIALNAVKPLVDLIVQPADLFYRVGHHWHDYSLVASVLALGFLGAVGVSSRHRYLVIAAVCAVIGQFSLSNFNAWRLFSWLSGLEVPGSPEIPATGGQVVGAGVGIVAYLLAFVFVQRAFRREENLIAYENGKEDGRIFGAREFAILAVIFLVALVLRMYALNVVVEAFEGELAAFSAGGTSVQGMFVANQGAGGPWAPLGILYYVPIYISTKLFGTTLIALRLSSAIVGVLTVPLVYLLASRLGGRLAGYIAAALFALNGLHIGWSRTDVHPHGVTTWPTLLMCYALLRAYDTRKMSWFGLVVFMMGLSWHQYPSGQSAVIIPLLAIGLFWITNRLVLPCSKIQCAVIACGLVVWFFGFPLSNYLADGSFRMLNPFTLTGPRATWSAGDAPQGKLELVALVAKSSLVHVGDVVKGIFFRQNFMCHQEWLRPTQGTFLRTVPWMEMPFVFIGIALLWRFRARFESAVMVSWLIAAILPGVLSEQAYPKRLSTFYPALDIIAAVALATLVYYREHTGTFVRRFMLSAICVAILMYTSLANHFWFSGRFWKYKEPADVQAAAQLAQAIRPDTIFVEYMPEGYDRAKYLYLLLDRLSDPAVRPNRWVMANSKDVSDLMANPLASRDMIGRSWVYTWTKLRDQLNEARDYTGWKRIVFLLQTPAPYYKVDEALIKTATQRCAHPKIENVHAPKPFVMIECELSDLR